MKGGKLNQKGKVMEELAPIVLFVYNRPLHTEQTLEALSKNTLAQESKLYIFADGPKEGADKETKRNIIKTREVIRANTWCKEVHIVESQTNKGLANSIIMGVSKVVNEYGKVIVLEDDMILSPGFLNYMNDALAVYKEDDVVMHISGYIPLTSGAKKLPETFFLRFMSCWGWGTWKRAWKELILDEEQLHKSLIERNDFNAFNLEGSVKVFEQLEQNRSGKISTWAVKWYSSIFLKGGLCLYPKKSLVKQIGIDGSGVHCGVDISGLYDVELADKISVTKVPLNESENGKLYFKRFYKFGMDSSFLRRLNIYKVYLLKKVRIG